MMKSGRIILYMTHDGLTDPLGQSQILPYLTGLADKGHYIFIISLEKQDRFKNLSSSIISVCAKHQIQWFPLPYHNTPPIISTLYDLYQVERLAKKLIKKKKIELIHCRSYLTTLIGARLKLKFGCSLIFDMRGFWADERVEGRIWNLNNPIYRIIYSYFKKKENHFLSNSDHIVSLTHNAKSVILKRGIKTPISVIPTCVDLALFDPDKIIENEKAALRSKLLIKNTDLVLLYLGSWGTWYDTNAILNLFHLVKANRSDAKLLLVTQDQVSLTNEKFNGDIIVTRADRQGVPALISLANVSVFFIKPTYSKKASSATKMAEILSMNVPVITNPGWGDIDILATQIHGITLIDPANPEWSSLNFKNVLSTRELITKDFSLTRGVESYDLIYQSL